MVLRSTLFCVCNFWKRIDRRPWHLKQRTRQKGLWMQLRKEPERLSTKPHLSSLRLRKGCSKLSRVASDPSNTINRRPLVADWFSGSETHPSRPLLKWFVFVDSCFDQRMMRAQCWRTVLARMFLLIIVGRLLEFAWQLSVNKLNLLFFMALKIEFVCFFGRDNYV